MVGPWFSPPSWKGRASRLLASRPDRLLSAVSVWPVEVFSALTARQSRVELAAHDEGEATRGILIQVTNAWAYADEVRAGAVENDRIPLMDAIVHASCAGPHNA